MSLPRLVKWQLKDTAKYIISVWAISVLFHQTLEWRETHLHKTEIAALAAEHFDDYMIYHSIVPASTSVGYGAEARFKSDSEVLKGGFVIKWEETIECDKNPYDRNQVYEWYATVLTSERRKTKPQPRSTPEEFAAKRGYVSIRSGTEYPIRYPNFDADCRLETVMTQLHKYGIRKIQTMYSEVVKVRGFHD